MNKIKWLIKSVLAVVLAVTSMVASGSVYLEISGGQATGLPIAVVPFHSSEGGLEDIAQIIRADLAGSGQFRALLPQGFPEQPHSAAAVNFAAWKKLGAENLVLGSVTPQGSGRYLVTLTVMDVFNRKGSAAPSSIPLLDVKFDGIRAEDMRALAHHLSDVVFEKIIGIKGIFSTRIAYVSVNQEPSKTLYSLEVADYDGYNPKQLLKLPFPLMSPAWSPDGKRLAFVSFEGHRAGIQIADVASGRIEKMTQFPGINGAPSWSPDGRSLALVLSKDGSPKIYTLEVGSKQLRQVTTGGSIDTEPFWDPSGQSLVFTSNRGGKPQVYRVNLNNGALQRLTFKGDYNARPSLTPDGKRLIIMHREEGGSFSIAVQNLDNGDLRVLTHARQDESPSLAPNGMMVLYGSQEGSRGVLGAVSLDGRIRLRLPAREGTVQEPAWSPFLVGSSR